MQKKNMNEESNDWGSIGIGAMIVFIALILVAAVASAVIIQTGEKLQQNAQQSGSDTQQEISGKSRLLLSGSVTKEQLVLKRSQWSLN